MYAQALELPLAPAECFHCGLPVPHGVAYRVAINGSERPMCCPGCCAVAQAIVDAGSGDYYRYRTAPALPPRDEDSWADLPLFDLPEIQQTFVNSVADHVNEASLIIDGITCAACVWLIERRIAALPGVLGFDINQATRRARVTWDDGRIRLSAILRAVGEIGYGAHPYDTARSDEAYRRENRAMLLRLFVAGLGMMQVMMYASTLYFADGDMSSDIESLMAWASLLLTAPVVFFSAGPFFKNAWRDLRFRRVGMDVPVSLGIGATFAASVWATITNSGEVYYDSIAMFVFLLLLARFLELAARAKAAQGVEQLARLAPAIAERVPGFPASRATDRVAAARLVPGDYALVRAGSAIPADGCVVEGTSRVDEALLTGESHPVAKRCGDALINGAMNVASPLFMRVERVGPHTVLAAIVRLLDRAMTEKPAIAQLADRVAQRFLSALIIVAAIVAAVWLWIDPTRALWITVAVLVVACPCALALAMPAALTASTGNLARRGVLVTRGHTLEALAEATHFVFDKTGTLTRGRFELKGVKAVGALAPAQCLGWAAALEAASEHPIARALRDASAHADPECASDVVNRPGAGIEGCIDGRRLRIGAPAFVAELSGPAPARLLDGIADGESVVALGSETTGGQGGWLAIFTFGDPVREDARSVIRALLDRGKTVSVLSGDRHEVVRHVARELGINRRVAEATPQGKLDHVLRLQAAGDKVAMIGDGVNDAPVLAAATVSVAMGCSTDMARASADAVLLSDRLQSLIDALDQATRTRAVIKQNLGWAIGYNVAALPLAAVGYVTPWMAGVGMAMSSLLVVANALRLTRTSPKPVQSKD